MNILITGGTGFIGSRLVNKLVNERNQVYVLTRNINNYTDTEYITYISYNYPIQRLPFIHAVVNLAGESLFGYWTEDKKARIISSRIETTEKLMSIIMQMGEKPDVFINGSAIGYYGISDEVIFSEATTVPGDDFLATVAKKWEQTAQTAEDLGIRTVYTRFGVVLNDNEGALPMMALPIKYYVGGKIGTGEQWLSWIHIDDCVELLYFALTNKSIQGPLNMTAPYPQRNLEFTKTLADVQHKPAFIPVPATMIKLVLGDMSQLITDGQYVLPTKAKNNNFTFKYPHLEDALEAIYD